MLPSLQPLPSDMEYLYSHASCSFFKNDAMRQLDASIGDLHTQIKSTETMIVAELEEEIIEHEIALLESFTALAEFDCVLAFADCAVRLNLVRPQMLPGDEKKIEIYQGRHPLQELITNYIPNDVYAGINFRVNIVTGANYSGKSCYIRQVGIIVYMAQIGSFVPCEAACLSVFRALYTKFASVDTCSVPQSTFQRDLSQVGSILRRADASALVLMDEFGKGTSPSSGIALLAAALKHLSNQCVTTFVTTHFLELFSFGLMADGEEGVRAIQMAIEMPTTDDGLAIPLFRLEPGVAESSAGILCAKMAGVQGPILARAKEVLTTLKNGKSLTTLHERSDNLQTRRTELVHQFRTLDWSTASDSEVERFMDCLAAAK